MFLTASFASAASAQDILYCRDGVLGTDRMDEALDAFVAAHPSATATRQTTMTACETSIAAGGWEAIVLFIQNNSGYALPNFDAYVSAGGRAIFTDWARDSARAATFGASYSGQTNATSVDVAAPLDAGVSPDPILLTNPGWGIFAMTLAPGSGATSLATLGDGSGIIVDASGRTIINGFLSDTGGSNLAQLYQNELLFILGSDSDGDGVSFGTDCDDDDPTIFPGASDASCDGVDQNCSGVADDGYVPVATSCGVGACAAAGISSCTGGVVADSCTAGAPAASDATCDGIDDDCSGVPDDDYAPLATSCGVGACAAAGITSCASGAVTDSCTAGAPAASDATCDGIDDDCSGVADEDYAPLATSCGIGACAAAGITSCASGAITDSCTAGTPAASDETCDGIDDDCSGVADEGYASTATSCGIGACAAVGTTSCASGAIADSCTAGTPAASDATCDGIDDDCSGEADEDYAAVPTDCGVGACASMGTTSCTSGAVEDSCVEESPAATDVTCDGIDDDCDDAVDEDACDAPDGGMPDAGTDADGGIGGGDASLGDDGGADAGSPDGGADGGCSCSVPGASATNGRGGLGALAMAALVGLVLARRRRVR